MDRSSLIRSSRNFGAAQYHHGLGSDLLDDVYHRPRQVRIPHVHAQTDDARLPGQQLLGDVGRAVLDRELAQHRHRLQFAKVGKQVAQP